MIRLLELFGGIGAPRKALERLGIDFEVVDYVEIDKYAVKSYNAMYGENYEPQDIMTWNKGIEVDMIFHGSPCQDFSLAGKQAGGDKDSGTRSSLLYETIRIVEKTKPKYVIWENVKNVISKKHRHNFDDYLEEMNRLGYTNYYEVLNAKNYGIPQNRERVFTISILGEHEPFEFPQKQELKLKLKDMLESDVDEKYYLSDSMMNYVLDMNEVQNGTKWQGRANNGILNKDIALTIGVRSAEAQRGGVTNFIVDGINNEIKVKELKTICLNSKGGRKGIEGLQPSLQDRVYDSNGLSTSITTSYLPSVAIKEATKKGYKEAYDGDSVNLEQPNSLTRRGRVGQQIAQTLTTSCNQAVVEPFITKKYKEFEKDKGYTPNMFNPYNKAEINDIAPTQSTQCGSTTSSATVLIKNDLKIRKLTPKECWRLMGFDDAYFDKARQVNSNSQLYKQAGNSIVVNVLEAIFKELFKVGE